MPSLNENGGDSPSSPFMACLSATLCSCPSSVASWASEAQLCSRERASAEERRWGLRVKRSPLATPTDPRCLSMELRVWRKRFSWAGFTSVLRGRAGIGTL